MIFLAALPVLLSLAVGCGARVVARYCSPKWTTRALCVLSLSAAMSTGLVLCVLATLAVAENAWVAHIGHWSAAALAERRPVPLLVGLLTGVAALLLLGTSVVHLVRTVRRFAGAAALGRALGPAVNGLVVVDDLRAGAYALPGIRGRTVVSTALLRQLEATERRAVLAHEAAHLEHRHFLYIQLTELAAAANPLLRPAVPAVRRAIEAWADDDAACAVGDRITVARAVAKASLASRGAVPAGALAMGSHGTDLAYRIGNLVDPRPRRTGRVVSLLAAVAVACALSAGVVALVAHADFETAQSSYGTP